MKELGIVKGLKLLLRPGDIWIAWKIIWKHAKREVIRRNNGLPPRSIEEIKKEIKAS